MVEKFGVEIEIPYYINKKEVKKDDIFDIVQDALKYNNSDQEITYSNREDYLRWNIKEDASCGWEITTPALELSLYSIDEFYNILKTIRKYLSQHYHCSQIDKQITNHCGLHIHLSRNKIPKPLINKLIHFFYMYENSIIDYIFPKRKNNEYIDLIRNNVDSFIDYENNEYFLTYDFTREDVFREHYSAINIEKKHTVEFRYAQGTINHNDIINWLKFIIISVQVSAIGQYRIDYNQSNTFVDLLQTIANTELIGWKKHLKNDVLTWLSTFHNHTKNKLRCQEDKVESLVLS